MNNLKPFDPKSIDSSLTRVVTYGADTYLLFPYISTLEKKPQFGSLTLRIKGPAATERDLAAIAVKAQQTAQQAEWFIQFSTPWLLSAKDANELRSQEPVKRHPRT